MPFVLIVAIRDGVRAMFPGCPLTDHQVVIVGARFGPEDHRLLTLLPTFERQGLTASGSRGVAKGSVA
jgi:hypothetical protein